MKLDGVFCWLMVAWLALFSGVALAADEAPRLVIVIDDMGNNLQQGQAALALSGPVTYAVLPHTAHAEQLAREANQFGKEVMLHAPMANTQRLKLGPGALLPSYSETHFKKVLNESLDAVPYAVGLNNHMGSLLTQQKVPMRWVMDVAKERDVFFLDSKTTPSSVAWDVAQQAGVPALKRDIFLDHFQTREFLSQQFLRAVNIARQHGYAVVIGHPYPVTTEFLQDAIPALDEAGVQLVSASALLMLQEQRRLLRAKARKHHDLLSRCDYSEGHDCQ